MRRILDLNQPSAIFLKVIGLFGVAIPVVLYCALLLLHNAKIVTRLRDMIKVSFAIGTTVLLVFLALVIVEQVQDHYFDIQYRKSRDRKLLLANGNYECQYCGNQKVKEQDRTCLVCGKDLRQPEAPRSKS